MQLSRRNLRRRLALEFVLIAGAIHLALIVIIIGIQERNLRREFDSELLQRVERIAFAAGKDPARCAAVCEDVTAHGQANAEPLAVLVRARCGKVLGASPGIEPAAFPAPEASRRSTAAYSTIDGGAVGRAGEQFRVVTLHEQGPPGFCLQVAASLDPVTESVVALRRLLFLLALPGAMIGTGSAAWLISGHFVRRIEDVTRAAQRIGRTEAPPRLELPAVEDEIGGMVAEMNAMLARLDGAFRAQERFIVNVTHELKTPVSVMLAEAQVLKRSDQSTVDRYREFAASVEEEMRRLASLLESFLTLARSGHGQQQISESLVDLVDVVLAATQQCDSAARKRRTTLNVALPSDEAQAEAGIAVRGDFELLVTLIANLVRNAIDSAPAESRISVGLMGDGREAVVTVSHQRSPGESPEGQRARSRALAFDVARGIAELHGGGVRTVQGDEVTMISLRLPRVDTA